jgi:hypothetical protein
MEWGCRQCGVGLSGGWRHICVCKNSWNQSIIFPLELFCHRLLWTVMVSASKANCVIILEPRNIKKN